MLNIVLYEPEIPPNTGNIIRLASNSGCHLHLIEPLGFSLDESRLRRAGLDYHDLSTLECHPDWNGFLDTLPPESRLFTLSTKGGRRYDTCRFRKGDYLMLGPETRGLPEAVREHPRVSASLRLPMKEGNRSLNLSNAAAIIVYEAWRQLGFEGGS